MKVWSHTLVRNEERYIWFALRSVVNYIDKMLVWDTGSTDNTVKIIKHFAKQYRKKVNFRQVGEVDDETYTQMRQKMLDETKSAWILILDGDEVWWEDSIKKIIQVIKNTKKLESVVTPYYNVVGDIYHYQDESAGRYKIDDRTGHLTIRFMNRNIPGLYTAKPHGQHGYFDKNDNLIQNREKDNRHFINAPFMHFTHMIRSSNLDKDRSVVKRSFKYKYELGKSFPKDFYYPEAFFMNKPDFVPSPWATMNNEYLAKSSLIQLPRIVKRKIWGGKSGY